MDEGKEWENPALFVGEELSGTKIWAGGLVCSCMAARAGEDISGKSEGCEPGVVIGVGSATTGNPISMTGGQGVAAAAAA